MSFDPTQIVLDEVDIQHFHLDNCVHRHDVAHFKNDFKAELRYNESEKQIVANLNLVIRAELAEVERSHPVECRLDVWFYFNILNWDDMITEENGKAVANITLQMSLLGIAFSTARGMLIERTRGTVFQEQYLPVVSPSSLLKRTDN
jgi:hypothetical protein